MIAATARPISSGPGPSEAWRTSFSSKMAAPATAGIDSKKENRAAPSRLRPMAMAASRVMPDRDTPGTSASDCAAPMIRASRQVISSNARRCLARRSTSAEQHAHPDHRAGDDRQRPEAAVDGLAEQHACHHDRQRPEDQVEDQANLGVAAAARAPLPPRTVPLTIAPRSRAKNTSTAASVPSCSTAVKAAPGSGHPRSAGTRRRCAVEEMGRNSVIPCTAPSRAASRFVTRLIYRSVEGADQKAHASRARRRSRRTRSGARCHRRRAGAAIHRASPRR